MSEVPTDPTAAQPDPAASQPQSAPRKPSVLKRIAMVVGAALVALLLYLFVWPSPIDPVAYDPPPPPRLEGPLAPNDRLQSAEWLAVGKLNGPEDVEVDEQGRIFTGTADGRVVRVEPDGAVTTIANTGGRPLGIARDAAGNLIVADAVKGLLSVDPQGKITTLVDPAGELAVGFVDDVTVGSDGMIYFSDASSKFGEGQFLYDMLEGRPHGRLLRYDPATEETTVLVDDLYFANGVALSPDEDFLLLNETYRFRTNRYWLTGPRAGEIEILLENLPGYPDNITSAGDGTYWLALYSVRNDRADWLSPRPLVKRVMAKLPGMFWPTPQRYAFVIKLDGDGNILDSFQDPSGQHLYAVTSAFERDGYLYLGSLVNDRIGKVKLP